LRASIGYGAVSEIRMIDTHESDHQVERALLVGAYTEGSARREAESLLEELAELVSTLGIPIVERMLVHHRENHARLLIGSGKAEEIAARVKELGCDVIVFDNELSPSQQRNWEELAGVTVIDRQEVILDIFARRAQTREARLQIELAQLEYSLPRLTRAWGHLVRQGGGIGARGEGETQLEQDKRRIRNAIDRCKRELETVRSTRATQRKDRQRTPVPNAAIVGYTNSGKSSLLRRLTGADVLIEDKLFATLDTTTRKVALPNHQPLLLTDTVGFVRRLPHRLVEAFRATLEEAALADFLIHLLDASQPEVVEFFNTTMAVLAELGADKRPMLVAFNKIDKITDPAALAALRCHFPDALFLSVKTGEGLEALIARMAEMVAAESATREFRIPQSESALIARLHREGRVLETHYEGDQVRLLATVPARLEAACARFAIASPLPRAARDVHSLRDKMPLTR
jgi:GTP-binding protein HflX